MGLDTVEIVMRLEEVFHLRLYDDFWLSLLEHPNGDVQSGTKSSDRESWNRLTAGRLSEEIIRRLQLAGWYSLDPTLESTLAELLQTLQTHYRQNDIAPDTQLVSLLVQNGRFQDWNEFTRLVPALLPELIWTGPEIPKYLVAILLPVSFGIAVGIWSGRLSLAIAVSAVSGIIATYSLREYNAEEQRNPRNIRIPPEIATVQLLAEYVHQSRVGEGMTAPWNEHTVWTTIQDILAHKLSVSHENVTPSAHLIRDLGMD